MSHCLLHNFTYSISRKPNLTDVISLDTVLLEEGDRKKNGLNRNILVIVFIPSYRE
jgi:hypothetical protein